MNPKIHLLAFALLLALIIFGCFNMTPRTSIPNEIEVKISFNSTCQNATCMCTVEERRPRYKWWQCEAGFSESGVTVPSEIFNSTEGDYCYDIRTAGYGVSTVCLAYNQCSGENGYTIYTCDDCCLMGGAGTQCLGPGEQVMSCGCTIWNSHSDACQNYNCCPLTTTQACTCTPFTSTFYIFGIPFTYSSYTAPCWGYDCSVIYSSDQGCVCLATCTDLRTASYRCYDQVTDMDYFFSSCKLHYESSFQGGKLDFVEPCNSSEMLNIISNPLKEIPFFMLGQGPSFSDYLEAVKVCKPERVYMNEITLGRPIFDYDELNVSLGTSVCFRSESKARTLTIDGGARVLEQIKDACITDFTLGVHTVVESETGDSLLIRVSNNAYIYASDEDLTPSKVIISPGAGSRLSLNNTGSIQHDFNLWFDEYPRYDFAGNPMPDLAFILNPDSAIDIVAFPQVGPFLLSDETLNGISSTIFVLSPTNFIATDGISMAPAELAVATGQQVCFTCPAAEDHELAIYKRVGIDPFGNNILTYYEKKKLEAGNAVCCWRPPAGTYLLMDLNGTPLGAPGPELIQYLPFTDSAASPADFSYSFNILNPSNSLVLLNLTINGLANVSFNGFPIISSSECIAGTNNFVNLDLTGIVKYSGLNTFSLSIYNGAGPASYDLSVYAVLLPHSVVYSSENTSRLNIQLRDPDFDPEFALVREGTEICFINPVDEDRTLTFVPPNPLPGFLDVPALSRVCDYFPVEELQSVTDSLTNSKGTIGTFTATTTFVNLTFIGPSPNTAQTSPGGRVCFVNIDSVYHTVELKQAFPLAGVVGLLPSYYIAPGGLDCYVTLNEGMYLFSDNSTRPAPEGGSLNLTGSISVFCDDTSQNYRFYITPSLPESPSRIYPSSMRVLTNDTVEWRNFDVIEHTLSNSTPLAEDPMVPFALVVPPAGGFITWSGLSVGIKEIYDATPSCDHTNPLPPCTGNYTPGVPTTCCPGFLCNATGHCVPYSNFTANPTAQIMVQDEKAFSYPQDYIYTGPSTVRNYTMGLAVNWVPGDAGFQTLLEARAILGNRTLTAFPLVFSGLIPMRIVDTSTAQSIDVPSGSDVTWRNIDSEPHDVQLSWNGVITMAPDQEVTLANLAEGAYSVSDTLEGTAYTANAYDLDALVEVNFTSFSPSALTMQPGQRLCVSNDGNILRNFTFDAASAVSLIEDEQWTPPSEGIYSFYLRAPAGLETFMGTFDVVSNDFYEDYVSAARADIHCDDPISDYSINPTANSTLYGVSYAFPLAYSYCVDPLACKSRRLFFDGIPIGAEMACGSQTPLTMAGTHSLAIYDDITNTTFSTTFFHFGTNIALTPTGAPYEAIFFVPGQPISFSNLAASGGTQVVIYPYTAPYIEVWPKDTECVTLNLTGTYTLTDQDLTATGLTGSAAITVTGAYSVGDALLTVADFSASQYVVITTPRSQVCFQSGDGLPHTLIRDDSTQLITSIPPAPPVCDTNLAVGIHNYNEMKSNETIMVSSNSGHYYLNMFEDISSFDPPTALVRPGSEICITNEDSVPHTIDECRDCEGQLCAVDPDCCPGTVCDSGMCANAPIADSVTLEALPADLIATEQNCFQSSFDCQAACTALGDCSCVMKRCVRSCILIGFVQYCTYEYHYCRDPPGFEDSCGLLACKLGSCCMENEVYTHSKTFNLPANVQSAYITLADFNDDVGILINGVKMPAPSNPDFGYAGAFDIAGGSWGSIHCGYPTTAPGVPVSVDVTDLVQEGANTVTMYVFDSGGDLNNRASIRIDYTYTPSDPGETCTVFASYVIDPSETVCIPITVTGISVFRDADTGDFLTVENRQACTGDEPAKLATKLNNYDDEVYEDFQYEILPPYNAHGPAWPSIITSEIYQPSVACVAAQLNTIDVTCEGCTSTLGVAFSDEQSAVAFMNSVLNTASDSTELVGLFVDVNNYEDKFGRTICDPLAACDCNYSILWDGLARIGNHTLYDYGKPSIVLSLELQTDELAGGCWSNENVSDFYRDLYKNRISQLAGSGVIGLSLACLQDGQCYPYPPPPLTSYGLLDSSATPKDPQYPTWFDACGRYYFNSEGITMGTFSAEPTNSTACDSSRLMALYNQYKCYAE